MTDDDNNGFGKDELLQVCVNIGSGKPFFYHGYLLRENKSWILFRDSKVGKIKINQNVIISISKGDKR